MIVVDTNILVYLYFPGQQSEVVEQVYLKNSFWVVPPLWKSEFRSIAALYYRKELLTFEAILEVMNRAEELLWGYEEPVRSEEVLSLIRQSTCSAYDCEFVALAMRLNTYLLTYDQKIIKEFPGIALTAEQYLKTVH